MSMTSVQRLGTIQATEELRRNAGMPLDLDWVNQVQANSSAIQSRASTLTSRRTVEQQWQAAWLLRAISCIDLTTLAGDDSPGRIRRLCAKARHPVRDDLLAAMDVRNLGITTAAVCVYPTMVPTAFRALEGSGIRVASVAAAYPGGLSPLKLRLGEIAYAVEAGAAEIDAVITREQVLTASWERLYDEVASFSAACGGACLKVVLATGRQRSGSRHFGDGSRDDPGDSRIPGADWSSRWIPSGRRGPSCQRSPSLVDPVERRT